jgi:hypothetical protein
MSDAPDEPTHPGSPLEWTHRVLSSAWQDLKSVYYANTPIWRMLKSAALVFLGLFTWAGSNLLLSIRPGWGFLWVFLSYGFVLVVWGPLTHFVVVPLVIRLRRTSQRPVTRWLSRHGSKLNLTVFALIVLVLAASPLGIMTVQFQLPAGDSASVNPQLQCTKAGGTVHCHLSDARGVDHVRILSGGERLQQIDQPPFDFNLDVGELETVRNEKQFTVELRDENDDLVRRYIRRADLIPGG